MNHYRSRRHEEFPDVIDLADVSRSWPTLSANLEKDIAAERTGIQSIEVINLPKDPISVRPLVRFSLRDRILYESLVYGLAEKVDRQIFGSVYSYRWRRYAFTFHKPVKKWLEMQKNATRHLQRNKQLHAARTDVTAFYESIHLETLIDDLEAATREPEWVSKLFHYLHSFQSFHSAWGIPQGSDASGILANLYLLPVDELLRRRRIKNLRYSDDMYLFGANFWELRDTLLEINDVLRSRRLSMATQKTSIMNNQTAVKFFRDAEKDAIKYGIEVGAKGKNDLVRRYFKTLIDSETPSPRDLRFAINRLKWLEDDYALSWILENCAHYPHMSKEFFSYMARFIKGHHREISARISRLMESGEINPYPYLQFQALRLTLRNDIFDSPIIDAAWRILEDKNRGSLPREFAVRYIARSGRLSSGMLMKHRFENEQDESMRRALMVGMYESGYYPKRLFSAISNQSTALGMAAAYLDSSPKIPVT
ncbi:RNA-directed DNA polymerase [Streptomyces lichenis]|uniref:Reverse transcriptase domain-containing protein n=1 Tax=Streptomyces lichenis TaxID=2306967 RepID=A0ABT0IK34_9ACTN|nr:RNA-directed DNA polymerase [Streptomyces lichenis]MCK8681672.1 reverse transcriptase domain-containing protein [Streptomyces lichenis]